MLKPLKVVFGVVLLLLFVGPAFAQTVDTAWVRSYNGPDNGTDANCYLVLDGTGNVYVAGSSWGTAGDFDFAMVKYSSSGIEEWVRRYNGSGNDADFVYALAVDKFNDVYVTGPSCGSGTLEDYTTIKYHPNGDTAWVRRYNGPGNDEDYATAVTVDTSGNVCVTGGSFTPGTGWRYVTIKYNLIGDTLWLREYGEYRSDAIAIASDDTGNFYVTGRSSQGYVSFENYDFATIKYLPDGDTAWVRRYNGTGDSTDIARAITVDGSGNVYVTGFSGGTGTGSDYATIRYYSNGDTAWVRRYNGPANGTDYANDIAVDDSGFVFVTGYSDSSGSFQDYATIKYDSSGNEVWVRRYDYGVTGSDFSYAIALDDSSNVYVTGKSGGGSTGFDFATIKYRSNGDTDWVMRYTSPGNATDYAQAIAVDDSGNVYVTGYCTNSETDMDYCTIKYVQGSSGVRDETGDRERPSEFVLSQNYPNPFNPTTKIEFTLTKSGFVTLQVYDVLGRKVRTLVSEELSSGYRSVIWDGKNDEGKEVASGVYFYQLKAGDISEPKKMLLLK